MKLVNQVKQIAVNVGIAVAVIIVALCLATISVIAGFFGCTWDGENPLVSSKTRERYGAKDAW